jgi:hypothetical protein
LVEIKKRQREMAAYPRDHDRLRDEMGDVLWYLTRLTEELAPTELESPHELLADTPHEGNDLLIAFDLGSATGRLLEIRSDLAKAVIAIREAWHALSRLAVIHGVSLPEIAEDNLRKTQSRWPVEAKKSYLGLFDDDDLEEEKLPRTLSVEFRRLPAKDGKSETAILRCNGLNFGDRLTDNISAPDHYRFHDIFHFAYAVHLGWSPVGRSLLKCKRKSKPKTDEAEDGARAAIIEEAVSAIVFSRAKSLHYYDGINQVDYDLLKTIQEFVQGFEVDKVPLWQWEKAILEGFRVFRALKTHHGGTVALNLNERTMKYTAPVASQGK